MHKLGLKILLGWTVFLPITAYSLGLGDINVKSFLNQPLRAEISIISARPGEIDDLIVGLADRAAFSRASLSRPSHLSELKFKIINEEGGNNATISVITKSAVKEPVLNFLVEADWAKGRVFREFTILLDPPYIAQQIAQARQAQEAAATSDSDFSFSSGSDTGAGFSSSSDTDTGFASSQDSPSQQATAKPIVDQPIVKEEFSNSGAVQDDYVNESAIQDNSFPELVQEAETMSASEPIATESVASESNNDSIVVGDGSTLWSVAKTLKSDGISMSQVMLALQRVNPQAFGKDNINNLKQGAVLRVPTQDEMAELSQHDAYVNVLEQNGLWDEYLASKGLATVSGENTQASGSSTGTTADSSDSALSILAVEEGDSDKAALRSENDSKKVSTLTKKLLLSEEIAESLKVENDDLMSRVKALEEQLSLTKEINNLVNIEDDNLAQLEQQLAQEKDALEDVQADNMQMQADEPMQQDSDIMSDEVVESPQPMLDDSMAETEMTDTDVVTMDMPAENDLMSDDVMDDAMTDQAMDDTVAAPSAEFNAPIIVSEGSDSSAESSMVDDIIAAVTSNPIVQGAIAGILLLVLLLTKFLKGRKSSAKAKKDGPVAIEDEVSDDLVDTQSGIIIPSADDEDETPINVPTMEEQQPMDNYSATLSGVPAVESDEEEEDEFSKTAIISASDMPAAEEVAEEQDETLDEVDVYLAYSLFDNAEELLKGKLEEEPNRADYRAKLLDTYFATKNTEAFIAEAEALNNLGDSSKKYWPKVQTMGYELDSSNAMFAEGQGGDLTDLTIAKPEAADFDFGVDSEDDADISGFDLSLDGDETNFNLDAENTSSIDEVASDDFSLDLDANDETVVRGEDTPAEDDLPDDLGALDFDLDLDDSSDDAEESIEVVADEDGGLEFNLDDDMLTSDDSEEVVDDSDVDGLEFNLDEIDGSDDEIVAQVSIEDDAESIDLDMDDSDALEIGLDDIESGEDDLDIGIDLGDDSDTDLEDMSLDIESTDTVSALTDDDLSSVALDVEDTNTVSALTDDDFDATQAIDSIDEFDATQAISSIDDLELPSDDDDNVVIEIDESDDVAVSFDSELDDLLESADLDVEQTDIISMVDSDSAEINIEQSSDDSEELNVDDIDISFDQDDDDLISEDITNINNIEELMLPDDVDEVATKLDLAKAFIDMGDAEGARSGLEEVLKDGSDEQKSEATQLLSEID